MGIHYPMNLIISKESFGTMKTLSKKLIAGAFTALCAVSAAADGLNVQAPVRVTLKPDLVVYYVNPSYLSGGSIIRVTVRNNGSATSDSAVLSGRNRTRRGGLGEASIPSLKPNHAVDLQLKLSQVPQKGDKIWFMADSKQHVTESNENNNAKIHTY